MGDGILVLNKKAGMTSHDAVNRVRRLYSTKQVGHTGTLDPMAEGVLCILVGRTVKASEYAVFGRKIYRAGLKLGITTDTEDVWGEVLTKHEGKMPTEAQVREAIGGFIGNILQVPPMYSALKVGGKKLVDLARSGVTVERESREITVYNINVEKVNEEQGEYLLDVECSKGTYIRTLCADIGAALGVGGAMSSLLRAANSGFGLENAVTLEDIEKMEPSEREALLLPCERLFESLTRIDLPPFFERLARCGAEIYQKKIGTDVPDGELVRLYGGGKFFAVARATEFEEGSALKPEKKFDLT